MHQVLEKQGSRMSDHMLHAPRHMGWKGRNGGNIVVNECSVTAISTSAWRGQHPIANCASCAPGRLLDVICSGGAPVGVVQYYSARGARDGST
ncbi:uncharacterized protein TRAVEDRAFT_30677 [Trametes versicolor FP-101664 SS1]|uniref:uncharacterized protein n=1 Tax=Trametes versicolor (strain FP-101664) TaxID=717944 RepID=UPI000462381D|nr:uncharacterized protein TRAVEDRAFT_30677 [Trametes versicolor FP-101664 SS1]EIW56133.1 hypothetical protein TRAVEDRAFT_30677 [Trametes versicolor FP-101664 SS1]